MNRFKPGKKKCKVCPEYFEKSIYRPLQEVCSPACGLILVRKREELKQQKEDRKQVKELKEKWKRHADWLGDLEDVINLIARLIDRGLPCISCGNAGKPQAGHFHSVGSDSTLRYNLHNIHIQDYSCNVHKHANIQGYIDGLIRWYGNDYFDYVKFGLKNTYHKALKLPVDVIKEKITLCRVIIKQLEKQEPITDPQKRIELRDSLNTQIGIYNVPFLK